MACKRCAAPSHVTQGACRAFSMTQAWQHLRRDCGCVPSTACAYRRLPSHLQKHANHLLLRAVTPHQHSVLALRSFLPPTTTPTSALPRQQTTTIPPAPKPSSFPGIRACAVSGTPRDGIRRWLPQPRAFALLVQAPPLQSPGGQHTSALPIRPRPCSAQPRWPSGTRPGGMPRQPAHPSLVGRENLPKTPTSPREGHAARRLCADAAISSVWLDPPTPAGPAHCERGGTAAASVAGRGQGQTQSLRRLTRGTGS